MPFLELPPLECQMFRRDPSDSLGDSIAQLLQVLQDAIEIRRALRMADCITRLLELILDFEGI